MVVVCGVVVVVLVVMCVGVCVVVRGGVWLISCGRSVLIPLTEFFL